MTEEDRRAEWHLDRKVSVSIIAALLIQAGGALWYAAQADSRLSQVEESLVELGATVKANRDSQVDQRLRVWDRVNDQAEALNGFRADLAGISARLDYMTRALDRLTLLREQDRRDAPSKTE